jgi:pyridoxine kinase
MPSLLSISSHIVAGRVGQSISSFAFARLGVDVWALPSVIYPVTPAPGAPRGAGLPQDIFDLALAGVEEIGALSCLAALHIGYLRTPEQVARVARLAQAFRAAVPDGLIFLDPILGDAPGGLYIPEAAAAAIKGDLLPRADIVTPNLFELGYLSGNEIPDEAAAIAAARALGVASVAVTSGPAPNAGEMATLLVSPAGAWRMVHDERPHAPHGTGDLLAALFLGRAIRGEPLADALRRSVSSVAALVDSADRRGLDVLPAIEEQEVLVAPPDCVRVQRLA